MARIDLLPPLGNTYPYPVGKGVGVGSAAGAGRLTSYPLEIHNRHARDALAELLIEVAPPMVPVAPYFDYPVWCSPVVTSPALQLRLPRLPAGVMAMRRRIFNSRSITLWVEDEPYLGCAVIRAVDEATGAHAFLEIGDEELQDAFRRFVHGQQGGLVASMGLSKNCPLDIPMPEQTDTMLGRFMDSLLDIVHFEESIFGDEWSIKIPGFFQRSRSEALGENLGPAIELAPGPGESPGRYRAGAGPLPAEHVLPPGEQWHCSPHPPEKPQSPRLQKHPLAARLRSLRRPAAAPRGQERSITEAEAAEERIAVLRRQLQAAQELQLQQQQLLLQQRQQLQVAEMASEEMGMARRSSSSCSRIEQRSVDSKEHWSIDSKAAIQATSIRRGTYFGTYVTDPREAAARGRRTPPARREGGAGSPAQRAESPRRPGSAQRLSDAHTFSSSARHTSGSVRAERAESTRRSGDGRAGSRQRLSGSLREERAESPRHRGGRSKSPRRPRPPWRPTSNSPAEMTTNTVLLSSPMERPGPVLSPPMLGGSGNSGRLRSQQAPGPEQLADARQLPQQDSIDLAPGLIRIPRPPSGYCETWNHSTGGQGSPPPRK
eukprot:gnl/TRDRNA2_/TRDRNA2_190429_c0_seq1.p1 gnl/TRDRNA2_/TRDRNA2_190429_c0~~gnl/TRDRNA2_/TRDRNA2_190429_c0_seq1.p1  ORF type:complete len:603 (-),score=97.94 gnl/TRDRNA2_/TRDRNA2_190429_c0_seq1:42-1850(-)